ncbi:MAG: UDP-N-acetylmuramoyl-tripeptide--D-alanyl-D-alanine ligase [Albidovulum sp.]|nr:UDP-N-acetylmuramoyl-tripeptide--D-alanyl-D-alanine ligase [Albidovulum sp.]MDE0531413.1 UDP-N-acetylmuramoyl-tripeptide--D-alanyl-D-alanine ligase [Albidovulum sp.]
MSLWTAREAAAATGGESTGDWSATGVSIDSRTLAKGDLFVALSNSRDGHIFVGSAFDAGASAAVVERDVEGLPGGSRLLKVGDGLAALESLGREARARSTAKVIAVTGSSGKTSTKEILRHALAIQGVTHFAEQSFNNHWGVPLTLARLPEDAKFAVVEIGMNHPGEISPLSKMAKPNVCIVTTIGIAHLAAFESIEDIAREKASIFSGLEDGGIAVVNRDSPGFEILKTKAAEVSAVLVTFGESGSSDWQICDAEDTEFGTRVYARIRNRHASFDLSSFGRHFATNALGALATIESVGGDIEAAMSSFANWVPPQGRGSRTAVWLESADAPINLIDDSFNANPESMDAALLVLASTEPKSSSDGKSGGRRIAILGDMLELGSQSPWLHEKLANHEAIEKIAVVHCAGPLMRSMYEALPNSKRGYWYESSLELAEKSSRLAEPGDVVLVKGSKGSKISVVAEAILSLNRES